MQNASDMFIVCPTALPGARGSRKLEEFDLITSNQPENAFIDI